MLGICNALNEVCNGLPIEEVDFETRLGVSRAFLASLHSELRAGAKHTSLRVDSRADAWADAVSVQAICVSVSGDPVDMSSEEARSFAEQLRRGITEADGVSAAEAEQNAAPHRDSE